MITLPRDEVLLHLVLRCLRLLPSHFLNLLLTIWPVFVWIELHDHSDDTMATGGGLIASGLPHFSIFLCISDHLYDLLIQVRIEF